LCAPSLDILQFFRNNKINKKQFRNHKHLFHITPCNNSRCASSKIFVYNFTFAMSSPVRPSVCLSCVTFVRSTQAIEIFGNVSTPFGILAIR